MSVTLKKFDLSQIPNGATICTIGKRNSGKSWLIREILYTKRDYPAAMILAPTDSLTQTYSKFVPDVFIHYQYRSELLSRLFARQHILYEKNEKRVLEGKKPVDTRTVLVMDDCLADKGSWVKDPLIAEVFFNGRHRNILFILSMQFPLGIKPEYRTNLDYVFIMGEDFFSNQKRIYEHYAGAFPTFDIFRKVMLEATKDFGCLVIDNRSRESDLSKKFFWYKATDPGNFIIGGTKTLRYNDKNYDPKWRARHKPFDVDEYMQKRNKLTVDVKLDRR